MINTTKKLCTKEAEATIKNAPALAQNWGIVAGASCGFSMMESSTLLCRNDLCFASLDTDFLGSLRSRQPISTFSFLSADDLLNMQKHRTFVRCFCCASFLSTQFGPSGGI